MLFWRRNCLLCTADAGSHGLCSDCQADLPRLPEPACTSCALPIPDGTGICGQCLRHPPAFVRTQAAFVYDFPLDRLIHAFKYHHQFSLLDTLTAPLAETLRQRNLPDAILPMPLHSQRLRERGYNQALLLAQGLAQALHLPLLAQACQRTRATAEQAQLSRQQRQDNLRQAFACNARVKGLHIALVDDVMTSGSSAEHLAQALLQAGARSVECWVAARALKPDN